MVLFKDLNDKASTVLEKNYGHDKPCEIEYRHLSKDLLVDNNVALKTVNGGVDASTSVKYLTPQSLTDVKLTSGGVTTVDAKWYRGSLVFGCKLEHKPTNKGTDGSNVACDLSGELKCSPLHMKLSYLPFSRSCSLSTVTSQEFPCGTMRLGGDISADANTMKLNYSVGGAFSYGETTKLPYGQKKKGLWVASVKSGAHGDSQLGKVIGHVHMETDLGQVPAQYAVEMEHTLADSATNLTMAGQFQVSKDTTLRLKCPHDMQNVVLSVCQNFGSVKATVGAEVDTKKLGGLGISKYGLKLSVLNNQK